MGSQTSDVEAQEGHRIDSIMSTEIAKATTPFAYMWISLPVSLKVSSSESSATLVLKLRYHFLL